MTGEEYLSPDIWLKTLNQDNSTKDILQDNIKKLSSKKKLNLQQ